MRISSVKWWSVLLGIGVFFYGGFVTYTDPFILGLDVIIALLWILAPCAVAAAIILLVAVIYRRPRRLPLRLLFAVFAGACITVLAVPINGYLQGRAADAAMAYPAQVAPLLEQYRREHGAYPSELGQLPSRPLLPRLLRGAQSYSSDGEEYFFQFPQPGGLINVYDYNSGTHKWELST
jgi:hypothetical protein